MKIRIGINNLVLFLLLIPASTICNAANIDSLLSVLSKKNNPDTTSVIILNKLSQYYNEHNANDSSLYYGEKAIEVAKKINYLKGLALALNNVGVQYNGKANFVLALKYYIEGYKIAEQGGNPKLMSNLMNSIGNAYLGNKDMGKALMSYKKSYEIATKDSNKHMMAVSAIGIGNVNKNNNNSIEALFYFKKASEIFKEQNNIYPLCISYVSIGSTLSDINRFDEAMINFDKAMELFKKTDNTYGLGGMYGVIGDMYRKKNDSKKAIEYYLKSFSIFEKRKANEDLKDIAFKLAYVYKEKKDFEKAFEYCELSNHYRDSVFNEENNKQFLDVEAKYETEKKEKEIILQKAALAKLQLSNNKIISYIVVFIILSILLLFFLRTRRLKKSKQLLEATVETRTGELKELVKERELLLKEIHHRVKNNLQVISGLLELQAEQMTDVKAKAAFIEGQSRVRSVALIHNNLYQYENLGAVELNSFVNDLQIQLNSIFNEEHIDIKFVNNIPPAEIDIDTAVPVGLVLNELFTNTYKYAFKGMETTEKDKKIEIALQVFDEKNGKKYLLVYKDNGCGLPKGMNIKKVNSLGLQLIADLCKQLKGSVKYEYDNGSKFIIEFIDNDLRKLIK